MIDVVLALLAGMLTVAAPCVLPTLPILLGASIGQSHGVRPVFIALGFATAFALAAGAFGLFADALGLAYDALRRGAVALLLVFGVLMIWSYPYDRLMARLSGVWEGAHVLGRAATAGNAGGFVLGVTLGLVWTPCAGPVLGSILALIATATDLDHALLLLAGYTLGAALPMFAIAYGGQYVSTRVRRIAPYLHPLRQAFGAVVVTLAVAMYFQYDTLLIAWLSELYPGLQPRL